MRIVLRAGIFLSLNLSRLRLTDWDVLLLPDAFENLHTLSMAFNIVMDVGLDALLQLASNMVTLDLEANEMVFVLGSPACASLWRPNSPLHHLNMSHNNFTIQSFIGLFFGSWTIPLTDTGYSDAYIPYDAGAGTPILPYLQQTECLNALTYEAHATLHIQRVRALSGITHRTSSLGVF